MLVLSVTPFKIDQNKIQNRSIDKVQNLGNERRYIYKDPRQDSGQRNISYTRYPKKWGGNSRKHPIWRLNRGENGKPKEPFYRQRSVIYGIVNAVCVYCEF